MAAVRGLDAMKLIVFGLAVVLLPSPMPTFVPVDV